MSQAGRGRQARKKRTNLFNAITDKKYDFGDVEGTIEALERREKYVHIVEAKSKTTDKYKFQAREVGEPHRSYWTKNGKHDGEVYYENLRLVGNPRDLDAFIKEKMDHKNYGQDEIDKELARAHDTEITENNFDKMVKKLNLKVKERRGPGSEYQQKGRYNLDDLDDLMTRVAEYRSRKRKSSRGSSRKSPRKATTMPSYARGRAGRERAEGLEGAESLAE